MELVERDSQFAHLTAWLNGEPVSTSRVILVHGAVGTGKTALLRAFAQRAAEEHVFTIAATCTQLESVLPYGVLDQLSRQPGLPPWFRTDLGEAARDAAARQDDIAMARAFSAFTQVIAGLAAIGRVLVTLDDVRHADQQSMRVLSEFARQLDSPRVLLVASDRVMTPECVSASGLADNPAVVGLRTSLLSSDGVLKMLRGWMSQESAAAQAREFAGATGGNPLLLRAFSRGESELLRTISVCLKSSPEPVLAVAQALAVHTADRSPAALAQLADVDVQDVEAAVSLLVAAGLHDGNDFTFVRTASRILDDMPATERTALHQRCARLLHHRGASADAVAHHLLLGDHVLEPWTLDVLVEAADRAMLDDRAERAVELLELALRCELDDRTTSLVAARLARAEWLLNPSVAARHLPALVEAAEQDLLAAEDLAEVARQLLWLGRPTNAKIVLAQLTDAAGRLPDDVYVWLAGSYPELYRSFPAPRTPLRGPLAELVSALNRGDVDRVPPLAGRLLSEPSGGSADAEAAFVALRSLLYVDALDEAERWCDQLTTGPLARRTPVWQAVVRAVQASIACRRGDYPMAVTHAQHAVTKLSHRAWGVAVGLPISVLVLAQTRMGETSQAARHLAQRVHDSSFGSPVGLHYLHARGEFHLAAGRVHAALADFLSCGELMRRWALDLTGLAPWRTSAAEAWLLQNNKDQARKLIYDQLARPNSDLSRTRAASLRLLAISSEPRQRPQLLNEALEILEVRGDRYELARVLGELGRTHKALGDRRRARMVMHRAWHVAQQCAAQPLCQELLPDAHEIDAKAEILADTDSCSSLTRSERRVAALAVMGYTNREIATKLFITISTVEQHLTRVFRKLNVRQRTQLPAELQFEAAKIA